MYSYGKTLCKKRKFCHQIQIIEKCFTIIKKTWKKWLIIDRFDWTTIEYRLEEKQSIDWLIDYLHPTLQTQNHW